DTGLIDGKLEELTEYQLPDTAMDGAAAAVLLKSDAPTMVGPWGASDSFQLVGERVRGVALQRDGEPLALRIRECAGPLEVDDGDWLCASQNVRLVSDGERVFAIREGIQHEYRLAPTGKTADAAGQAGTIRVPMHGKIVGVSVREGDEVERGDMLFSVEAMKMEHAVLAPADGTVTALAVIAGQQVEANAAALVIVAGSAEADT
ncbi:biotin/lipoyl-binding protein, partial [Rhizobiaceae bacterium]|nr:biotin/lipoyl-binding protein [Rhizobiaceae bacterium]